MKRFTIAVAILTAVAPTMLLGSEYHKGGQDTDGTVLVVGSDMSGRLRGGPRVVMADGTDDHLDVEAAVAKLRSGRTRPETVRIVGGLTFGDSADIDSYTRIVVDGSVKAADTMGETTPAPLFRNEDRTNGNVYIEFCGGGTLDGNNQTLWLVTDTNNSATWVADDVVTDNGGGTTWTGVILSVNGKLVQIHLDDPFDWTVIDESDGVSNTTQTETDTLEEGCVLMAGCDQAITTDSDQSAVWAVGDRVHDADDIGDHWVGYIWAISGTSITVRMQKGCPFRVLATQTIRNLQYLTIDCGTPATVADWVAGNEVMNDTGNGDDWVGDIVSKATDVLTVRLRGTYIYSDVSNADGIENVTLTEVDTIDSHTGGTTDTIATVAAYTESNLIDIQGGSRISVHDLQLNGAKADGVRFNNVVGSQVYGCTVYGSGRNAVLIDDSGEIKSATYTDLALTTHNGDAQPVSVTGNNVRYAGLVGIYDYRSHDTLISGNRGEHCGLACIMSRMPIGAVINGNRVEYAATDAENGFDYSAHGNLAIEIIDDPGNQEGVSHQSVSISNNVLAGAVHSIYILPDATLTDDCTITIYGNTIINPTTTGIRCTTTGTGLTWTYMDTVRLEIVGNTSLFVTAVSQRHVFIQSASVVNSLIRVDGNRFEAGGYAVEFDQCDKAVFSDNLVVDVDKASVLLDDSDDVKVERNDLFWSATDNVFTAYTGTASGQFVANRCYEDYRNGESGNRTLEAAESGTTYDNTGATGTTTLTLPVTSVGLEYTFVRIVAQEFRIDPNAADNFRKPDNAAMADGEYYKTTADGSLIHIECLQAGEWQVMVETGTWAEETP